MKKNLRKVLMVVLALVLAGSLGMILYQQSSYQQGDTDYAAAESLAGIPQETVTQPVQKPEKAAEENVQTKEEETVDPEAELIAALGATDLAALRAVNEDVLGWITIPGTEVNYPVLQCSDNDYYLKHTWKGERSSVGAIFVDYRNSAGFDDDNTLIYGHNMKNRSMFGSLKYYLNDGHYEVHPSIYLVNDDGVHRYDIYAIYEASVEAVTYDKVFESEAEKTEFIHYGIRRSVVDTGIVPEAKDRIITLSTCTGASYATRWVVQAVLTETVA